MTMKLPKKLIEVALPLDAVRVLGDLTALTGHAKMAKISAVQIPIQNLDRERAADTHSTWSLSLRTPTQRRRTTLRVNQG
jgi:hypothetical protein